MAGSDQAHRLRRAQSNAAKSRRTNVEVGVLRELLLTWPREQLWRPIPAPLDCATPEWKWKHEERHGAPKLADRQNLLELTLKSLAVKGRDLDAIVAALHKIKQIALDVALNGQIVDNQGARADEADLVRSKLQKWLPRAIALHKGMNPDRLSIPLRFQRQYEAVLTSVTFDVPLGTMTAEQRAERDLLLAPSPKEMPRRRGRRGHPEGPVVAKAKEILSTVRVPREHRTPLLWAIGLVAEDGTLRRRR